MLWKQSEGPSGIRGLSDEHLLRYAGVAGYTPEGLNVPILEKHHTKFLDEIRKRGLNEDDIFRPGSFAEATNLLSGYSDRLGKDHSNLLERFATGEQTARLAREDEERRLAIANMEGILADFQADPTFDNLLARIRELPPTFSPELQQYMRNQVATQVRTQEVARLRRIRAARGTSGRAGASGAEAFLADQAAFEADALIASEFADIEMQALNKNRADELQKLGLEESLYSKKLGTELQLSTSLAQARQGLPYSSVVEPLQGYSAFLQAVEAQRVAEELARDQIAASKQNAMIGAGASILGGAMTGGATLLGTGATNALLQTYLDKKD